jgi:hypothetical protein
LLVRELPVPGEGPSANEVHYRVKSLTAEDTGQISYFNYFTGEAVVTYQSKDEAMK